MEPIPFLDLSFQHDRIRNEIKKAFTSVLDRNWFILGKEVEAFEQEFASYCGTTFCIGTGNGLDALTLALESCDVGEGDEVIVPAHTYFATWLAIARVGAIPRGVDADHATFNMDIGKLEEVISPATKAIIPVHMYGQACDMTRIEELAQRYNVPIIEDNAQAHGATWRERRTGSFGTINATSFYPTKNLGALGDGGAVTTFDPKKAEFIRRRRHYGLKEKDVVTERGMNSRLDELQAAFLRIKLLYIDEWNNERRRLAEIYFELLQDTGDLILPRADKEGIHVYHLFVVRTEFRDELRAHLRKHEVETLIHYPVPPHMQIAFREFGYERGHFPSAELLAERSVSLPLFPGMTDNQVGHVAALVKKYYDGQS